MEKAIELKGISKYFGGVAANKDISLEVNRGEILSLLGENGSGKTTLMNMLSGIYFPDEGSISVGGKHVNILSPKDAFDLGIGMVHQHFKLIDTFTATENIILGLGAEHGEKRLNITAVTARISELIDKYGFHLDPSKKIYNMPVSEKQSVEIVKLLYRGADILILDEPTAVLTPQETDRLFSVLRNMRDDGKAIIIITHKLHEVLSLSDRVAVLRKGEYIGSVNTSEATETSLTEMMVGAKVTLDIGREEPKNVKPKIQVKNLNCVGKNGVRTLTDVSFDINSGEVLGIAGIAGSGQKELLEAISGLCPVESGDISFVSDGETGVSLLGKTPRQIRDLGVALSFVPEDRLGMGLVANMDLSDNVMLRSYYSGRGFFLNRRAPREQTQKIVEQLKVVTPSTSTLIRRLSGGNVQKVLVGREIANAPEVLLTAYAVRGLDINTSYAIYNIINEQKARGTAVVYVGEDLDVLLGLSDRILVLCGGRVSGIVDARSVTKEQVGLLMTQLGVRE